jgi:hypothetical protein
MKPMKMFLVMIVAAACGRAVAVSDSNGTGLFLEPGVTYSVTNSNVDIPTATNSSAGVNGFGVVLRAGVHVWDRFFAAADGRYALLRFEDNADNVSVGASSWDVAPTIGVQMPDSGPRLYVGYVVSGNLDPQSTNGRDFSFDQAQGWRIGAGLMVQHVSVNIEWQRLHYGNSHLMTSSRNYSSLGYNPEGLVASVTFPIDFN